MSRGRKWASLQPLLANSCLSPSTSRHFSILKYPNHPPSPLFRRLDVLDFTIYSTSHQPFPDTEYSLSNCHQANSSRITLDSNLLKSLLAFQILPLNRLIMSSTSSLSDLPLSALSALNEYPRGIHASGFVRPVKRADDSTVRWARLQLRLDGNSAKLFEEDITSYAASLPIDPTDDEWHEMLLDIVTSSTSLAEPVRDDLTRGTTELVPDWDGNYTFGRRGRENEGWDTERRRLWHCLEILVKAAWAESSRSTEPPLPTTLPQFEPEAVDDYGHNDLYDESQPHPQSPEFLTADWLADAFPTSKNSFLAPISIIL